MKRTALLALLGALGLAGSANCWSLFGENISIGTAYRAVTSTAVFVGTGAPTISSFTSSTQPGVVRLQCDYPTVFSIDRVVTPAVNISSTRVAGDAAEYFSYYRGSNIALQARSVSGTCGLSIMGQ